jgi:RNA polymerase sigma factor (sigma-70 family)
VADGGIADRLPEHVRAMRRYALVLTRDADAAEDLVQESLARAIAAADSWRPGTDLRAWLFAILHNAHVSQARKAKVRREATMDLADPLEPARQPQRVELRQVLDGLARLPAPQRQPILLVALAELSYAEAARLLEVPLGTFMSRLGRGRAALRRLMGEATTSETKSHDDPGEQR